jgi:acetyl-CoA acyltransferase 2
MATKNVFIVAAKRTPFGAFGGKLAHLTATELGGLASKAAISQLPSGVKIDSTIYGNVIGTSAGRIFLK